MRAAAALLLERHEASRARSGGGPGAARCGLVVKWTCSLEAVPGTTRKPRDIRFRAAPRAIADIKRLWS